MMPNIELSREEIEEILEDQFCALQSDHINSMQDHDVSACPIGHFDSPDGYAARRQAIIRKLAPFAPEAI